MLHDGCKFIEILRQQSAARQRQHDGVFPMQVPPVALKKAAQHITQHIRIAGPFTIGQLLQLIGQFMSEAFIRRVFETQLCEMFCEVVFRPRPALKQREEPVFLELVVYGQIMTQVSQGDAAHQRIDLVRQGVGYSLEDVAQSGMLLMRLHK